MRMDERTFEMGAAADPFPCTTDLARSKRWLVLVEGPRAPKVEQSSSRSAQLKADVAALENEPSKLAKSQAEFKPTREG